MQLVGYCGQRFNCYILTMLLKNTAELLFRSLVRDGVKLLKKSLPILCGMRFQAQKDFFIEPSRQLLLNGFKLFIGF